MTAFPESKMTKMTLTMMTKGEKNGDLACISKKCCIFATSIAKNLKLK